MKSKGFTLLETMIAMTILAGGLTLLVSAWGSSFLKLKRTQTQYELALLLEKKMGEIEFEHRGKALSTIPEESEGDFGSEFKDYTWTIESKPLEFPDISTLLSAQDGGVDQMTETITKQLVDLISKGIKEVKVTVIYKPENIKKPIEASVVTYFVDYNVSMMPGGLSP